MDQLLQVLCIKGRAKPEAIEAAIEVDPTATIEQCERDGLIENTKLGYRITDLGRQRVDELYAHEREHAGAVIEEVYETFLPINDEVKQIVTDWQMREVDGQLVLNDHQDPAHDESVITRLHDTDAKVSAALASLSRPSPASSATPVGWRGRWPSSATATRRWSRPRSRTATTPSGSSSTRSSSCSPAANAPNKRF